MGKFIVKRTRTGIKFDLIAANGKKVASSEVYTSSAACENGIASVVKNAAVAKTEDRTVDGFEKKTNPKFELYTDKAGKFRFRLKAGNGEIIAVSGSYKVKSDCLNGINSVKRNTVGAEIAEMP